jgi:DNA polymerase-3 subunit gamma/tau
MSAQALYRKWRSRTFDEVVAQEHVTRTLRNALQGGRIVHAYLFAGPRGTGKTSTARLLAKAVNCLSAGKEKPCNDCPICRAIDEGRMLDLIEIDAASNRGIDEIRDLREKVNFRPGEARYKIYIIDEVHMLTSEAFNALLKTLEEPPPHVIFVLATTEPHKIPPTVLSRCQRFDFRRIPLADIINRLSYIVGQEGLMVEPAALELIARQATGSLRDAISLLDQMVAYGGEIITLAQVQAVLGVAASQTVAELVDYLARRNIAAGLETINRAINEGSDPRQLARETVEYLRGLMLLQVGDGARLLNLPGEVLTRMQSQAGAFSRQRLLGALRRFNQAGLDLKVGFFPQLQLEIAFVESAVDDEAVGEGQGVGEEGRIAPQVQVGVESRITQARPPVPEPQVQAVARAGDTGSGVPTEQQSAAPQGPAAPAPPAAKLDEDKVGARRASPVAKQAAPSPVRDEVALDTLRANWNAVLTEIRPHNRTVEALLRGSCEPLAVQDQVVIIGFYHEFHKKRVEEPHIKELVERAISRVAGASWGVRCVTTQRGVGKSEREQDSPPPLKPSAAGPGEAPRRVEEATPPEDDPVIRHALKLGGQIANVQE